MYMYIYIGMQNDIVYPKSYTAVVLACFRYQQKQFVNPNLYTSPRASPILPKEGLFFPLQGRNFFEFYRLDQKVIKMGWFWANDSQPQSTEPVQTSQAQTSTKVSVCGTSPASVHIHIVHILTFLFL